MVEYSMSIHDVFEVESVSSDDDHHLHPEPLIAARVRENHNMVLAELRTAYPDSPRVVFHLMAGIFIVYTDLAKDMYVSGRFAHEIYARIKPNPRTSERTNNTLRAILAEAANPTWEPPDEVDVPMLDGSPFTETVLPTGDIMQEAGLMPPRDEDEQVGRDIEIAAAEAKLEADREAARIAADKAAAAPPPATRTRAPKTIEIGTPIVASFSIRIDLEDLFPLLKLPEGVDRKALNLEALHSITVRREVGGFEVDTQVAGGEPDVDIDDPLGVSLNFRY